jgi:hypothetical protein
VQRVFGGQASAPTDSASVIAAAAARYELFHITLTRGKPLGGAVERDWARLMGDRLLVLDQVDGICDLMGVCIASVTGRLDREAASHILAETGMQHRWRKRALRSLY